MYKETKKMTEVKEQKKEKEVFKLPLELKEKIKLVLSDFKIKDTLTIFANGKAVGNISIKNIYDELDNLDQIKEETKTDKK